MTQMISKTQKTENYRVVNSLKTPAPDKAIWAYYLALISCFTVVWGHTSAGVLLNTSDSFYWMVSNITDSMGRWSITAFTMLSGFLLLNPAKKYSVGSFYQKRAGRILLPLIFWCLFYAGVTAVRRYLAGSPITLDNFVVPIFTGHAFYHLWYLYMLIGVYLVIPFMRKIIAALNKRHLVILCGVLFLIPIMVESANFFFLHTGFINGNPVYIWFLYFLGYILAGHLIGQEPRIRISTPVLAGALCLSIVVTAAGCYLLTSRYSFDLGYYFYSPLSPHIIIGTLSVFALAKKLLASAPNSRFLEKGYQLAFGTFLIHPTLIIILRQFGIEAINFNPLISIPAVCTLTFLLSVIAALVISKIPYLRRVI